MEYFEGKRSGQIPAFGNWDSTNELPITQYFENARQAGLVRYKASALTADDQHQYCNPYMTSAPANGGGGGGYPIDHYAPDSQKPSVRLVAFHPRKVAAGGAVNNGQSNTRRRCGCPPHVKERHGVKQEEVQFKVYDVVDLKQQQMPRGGPRPRTRSQQLYYNHNQNSADNCDQNQKKQHCPKHYSAASADNGNPILTHHRPSTASATTTTTVGATAASAVNVKPVDEDLYKIPPELLLQTSKRKKMLGFFSKCLVPPCKA